MSLNSSRQFFQMIIINYPPIFQEIKSVSSDTQGPLSDSLKEISSESGRKISNEDIQNISKVIDLFTDSEEVELTKEVLGNLMSTIDNVHHLTDLDVVQESDISDSLRESAVKIASKLAENPNTLQTGHAVGQYDLLIAFCWSVRFNDSDTRTELPTKIL